MSSARERAGLVNMVMRTKMFSPKLFVLALMMIFAITGLLAFAGASAPNPGWDIQIVDSDKNVGRCTSIALDSSNNAHISYLDWIENLKYARWTGNSWSIQTVDSEGGDISGGTSIALDSSGLPHISYNNRKYQFMGTYYAVTEEVLKYARWTGNSWSIQTVDSAGFVGTDTSVALDSSSNPHISYTDFDQDYLKYARWTGNSWSIQTVDSGYRVGGGTSIALDSSGYPHIAYRDSGNNDLKYARWIGSSWQIQIVDNAEIVALHTSIALDSSSNPHISYTDYKKGALKYARRTGDSWSIQTVDSGGNVGEYTSIDLVLDSSGNPHISYYDSRNSDLKYARWTGNSWSIQTVDSEGDVGEYTSIALDSYDYPHISYYDDTNGVLKYARAHVGADAGSDRTVNEDVSTTLDGSAFTGNVGITGYTWTFTDVTPKTLTGDKPAYTFSNPGVYTITFNVTDAAGNWATDTVVITVLDVTNPVADAGQDQTVNMGDTAAFDAANSTDNVGIVSYEWDFGDGATGTGKTITHEYAQAGTYTVTLTVEDAAENQVTDTTVVTVNSQSFPWWIIAGAAIVAAVIVAGVAILWRRRKKTV